MIELKVRENIMIELIRCGCGGEASMCYGFEHRNIYAVECDKCGICTCDYNTEAEAIQAWNRAMSGSAEKSSVVERTAKVETVEKPNVYKCSECGQYFHSTAWGSPVEYCSRCGARLEWE